MKKHAFYKKTISVIVSAAFLLSTFAPVIPPCNVWAESVSGNTQFVKELSAGTFTMPQELGYIKESVEIPDSTRTVIHIQDAHCNYCLLYTSPSPRD